MPISRLSFHVGLTVCILMHGCWDFGMDKTGDIAVIDVIQQFGKYQEIPVSEFVTELEYIPLETCDDCLIGQVNRGFIVTSTHIFVAGGAPFLYAFDRDGRFIGKIGSVGQGPGEYRFLRALSIDENKQSLYVDALYYLLEYSWDGIFRRSFKIPSTTIEINNRIENWSMDKVFFVRDNLFVGHTLNFSGNEKYNFHLINDFGQVVKSFDNHILLDRRPRATDAEFSMRPFRISERMYLKEYANDTLYCLNEQNELVPQFVFDLGKYTFSKKKRENDVEMRYYLDGVIIIPDELTPMVGTPNYIFFSIHVRDASTINIPYPQRPQPRQTIRIPNVRYVDIRTPLGIYDMVNQKTRLLDTHPVTRRQGLINNLDGGLSFWPKYYNYSDNELIDLWQAHTMKELLTDDYFNAHEIKAPQAHQKLKELLGKLDEDDNPVVVIGKLKK